MTIKSNKSSSGAFAILSTLALIAGARLHSSKSTLVRKRTHAWFAVVFAAALMGIVGSWAPPAAADTTAATDDHSVSVPTGWWWYTGVTAQQVSNYVNANGARLTELDIDPATGLFTVRMVRNSGAYAVPGWWWYYGLTATQLSQVLTANNARLIDLNVYGTPGNERFAAVMVSNTGTSARAWWWLWNASSTNISSLIGANNARLTKLVSYDLGAGRKFAALFVQNSGADAKGWHWWYGQTLSSVASKLSSTGDRLVDLSPRSDGLYDIVSYHDTGHKWWWYYGMSMSSLSAAINQTGGRLINVHRRVSGRSTVFDAVLIDNTNAETGRIRDLVSNSLKGGSYGFWVKPVGGASPVALQTSFAYEPASSIKVLYHAYAFKRIYQGLDHLSDPITYYNYPLTPSPTGNPKDVCPDPAQETAANAVTTTLENALAMMMKNSDNRTTRALQLYYGADNVTAWAQTMGMKATYIKQIIGCGYRNNLRNAFTLADAGKLYEAVENGTLLGLGGLNSLRDKFYSTMSSGSVTSGSPVGQIVASEAAKVGKSAVVSQFLANMTFAVKGGSYNICSNCSSSYLYIRANSGVMRVPFRSGLNGPITRKSYVYGSFVHELNLPCASSNTTCTAKISADSAYNAEGAEAFRAVIRAALVNWL
jgi:hypothetical protein